MAQVKSQSREQFYQQTELTPSPPLKVPEREDESIQSWSDEDLLAYLPEVYDARQRLRQEWTVYAQEIAKPLTREFNERFADMPPALQAEVGQRVLASLERAPEIYRDRETGGLHQDRLRELMWAASNEVCAQYHYAPAQDMESYLQERRQMAQGRKPR